MNNLGQIFEIIVGIGFLVTLLAYFYRFVNDFLDHSIIVNAEIIDLKGLVFENSDSHAITVSYTYLFKNYEIEFSAYLLTTPAIGDKIDIRISKRNFKDAAYYGKHDRNYYFRLVAQIVVIISLLAYTIHKIISII